MKIPYIPEDAPFNEDQRAWLAGFLAGLHSRAAIVPGVAAPGAVAGPDAAAAPQVTTVPLNILYGTQTGNAEAVAEDAAEKFQAQGFTTRLHELDAVEMDTLAEMEQAIMVVSTYGEGEMPDNGEYFWEGLSADSAPRMEQLKFGVIALGDTSYDQFCQAGKLIDMRLEQLGATRLVDRVDCDVDFEDSCEEWLTSALAVFELTEVEGAGVNDTAQPAALVVNGGAMPAAPEPAKPAPKKSEWTRKNPFHALVMDNHVLSGEGSAKEIRHVAFHLGASGMEYAAGDALGVVPTNSPALVSEMLLRLGASKDQAIADHDEPLGELLANRFEIRTPSREFLAELEKRAEHEELSHVLSHQDKEALDAFLWGKDTLDLLNLNPKLNVSPEEFLSWCKPLQHRAYSISSSPLAHPGEVHLTVAAVRWQKHGREHQGVASCFLADQCEDSTRAPVFITANKSFRVPEDDDRPIIMVGPGTGIAPFRAFLEERRERGAKGKNWLFFGDQHREHDFIYEDEIAQASSDGVLSRLDLAFSRDQADKIYVQNRMHENAKDLFAWLEEGGYFYVCGDATRMAKDVDQALNDIIQQQGGFSDDRTADYVAKLKREKRYVRDVY